MEIWLVAGLVFLIWRFGTRAGESSILIEARRRQRARFAQLDEAEPPQTDAFPFDPSLLKLEPLASAVLKAIRLDKVTAACKSRLTHRELFIEQYCEDVAVGCACEEQSCAVASWRWPDHHEGPDQPIPDDVWLLMNAPIASTCRLTPFRREAFLKLIRRPAWLS